MWDIVNADCVDWLPKQASVGFCCDAVITDAPYHLTSIAKRFGKPGSAPAQHGKDGAAARLSKGFMSSPTDVGDVAFRPETWRAVASVMKPGGRIACFAGTRTWWKLAAAIDAAGFEIEDTILWVYGQGLVLQRSRLKPCVEPILLARMPGPVLPLQIDDCRVPAAGRPLRVRGYKDTANTVYSGRMDGSLRGGSAAAGETDLGRWPGNLILSPDPDILACFPDAPGQLANAKRDGSPKGNAIYGKMNHDGAGGEKRADSGSAARFFTQCPITDEERPLLYAAKARPDERMSYCKACQEHFRNNCRAEHAHGADDWEHIAGHPTIKPQSILRFLTRLLTKPGELVLDPFAGSGSGIEAAVAEGRSAVGIELDPTHAASGIARMRSAKY